MADIQRSSKNSIQNNSPRLFTPLVTRGADSSYSGQVIGQTIDGGFTITTSAGETGSYLYDLSTDGLKSTQQLKINWENFGSHTFFQSARVQVNTAFDLILNRYPFDGKQKDVELFLGELTGYEKYIFDNFPKYEGYLHLSGTNISESFGGAYVEINDIAGTQNPEISTKKNGYSFLNPGTSSFCIEFHLRIPNQNNEDQFILDKHIGTSFTTNEGWAVTLQSSTSSLANVVFNAFTIGGKYLNITASVQKGVWNHIVYNWDRTIGNGNLSCFVNTVLQSTASSYFDFDSVSANTQSLFIGTGSQVLGYFDPKTTFSGSIDELRIWTKTRNIQDIKENATKTIFAQDNLVGYYRFDEPAKTSTTSRIVIDSSGNSLHGSLSSYSVLLGTRTTTTESLGFNSPMINSRMNFLPILFPNDTDVENFYLTKLSGSREYDEKNPSLITKLVPKHYLLEGKEEDSLETEEGSIVDDYSFTSEPRSSELGGTQAFILLLYTWAKFFDEIKLFTKAFGDLGWVDYNQNATVPDVFLQQYAKELGIELPSFFQNSSIQQYIYGDNIDNNISINSFNLQKIQNEIWRRLLTNIPNILKSRGTTYAIKQYVRSLGLEPDHIFRIREYGGPNKRALQNSREEKVDTFYFADFSQQTNAYLYSTPGMYQEGIRTEQGYPYPDNTFLIKHSNSFFSGSWTYEGWYQLNPNSAFYSQSLVKVEYGSLNPIFPFDMLLTNLVTDDTGTTTLYYNDNTTLSSSFSMSIPANLYDGELWNVSFGRQRWDEDELNSFSQSLYFLRAAKKIGTEIIETHTTSLWFNNAQKNWVSLGYLFPPFISLIDQTSNLTGSYLVFGNKPVQTTTSSYFLNNISLPDATRTSNFDGELAEIKFYSKNITNTEWLEHIRNPNSEGVYNPENNWNFETYSSGSWQRLRHHFSFEQPITSSDGSGNITVTDFSQLPVTIGTVEPKFYLSGNLFTSNTNITTQKDIHYTQLSTNFDRESTDEKIRIRGFNNEASIENDWENFGPSYELLKSEEPTDSTKIGIDFSIVDALNKDIITIFATLDEFENLLGAPENQFEESYLELDILRKNYFNKLNSKLNIRSFFGFYKWFDTNFGTYISQLLPYNAKFQGMNYIVESHILERAKMQYKSDGIYHNQSNKDYIKANITLQFITGRFGRY